MKRLYFVLCVGLCSFSVIAAENQMVQAEQLLQLVEKKGARCSDGTYCQPGYAVCCYVKGVEQCVKHPKDCSDR